jgi:hypothetical protein
LLLDWDAEIDIVDKYGSTALHSAIEAHNLEITSLLLERGANVNVVDAKNRSPLYYANLNGYLDLAKLLIDEGADYGNVRLSPKLEPLLAVSARNAIPKSISKSQESSSMLQDPDDEFGKEVFQEIDLKSFNTKLSKCLGFVLSSAIIWLTRVLIYFMTNLCSQHWKPHSKAMGCVTLSTSMVVDSLSGKG